MPPHLTSSLTHSIILLYPQWEHKQGLSIHRIRRVLAARTILLRTGSPWSYLGERYNCFAVLFNDLVVHTMVMRALSRLTTCSASYLARSKQEGARSHQIHSSQRFVSLCKHASIVVERIESDLRATWRESAKKGRKKLALTRAFFRRCLTLSIRQNDKDTEGRGRQGLVQRQKEHQGALQREVDRYESGRDEGEINTSERIEGAEEEDNDQDRFRCQLTPLLLSFPDDLVLELTTCNTLDMGSRTKVSWMRNVVSPIHPSIIPC